MSSLLNVGYETASRDDYLFLQSIRNILLNSIFLFFCFVLTLHQHIEKSPERMQMFL